MLVSVTRLRLRSIRYLLPFAYHANRSRRQAESAAGCRRVHVRKTRGLTFWTLSLWESEAALRQYLTGGAHRQAMPKLAQWCDEAAVTHWEHETTDEPSWDAAAARLAKQGRLSRVLHPSAAHQEGRIEIT